MKPAVLDDAGMTDTEPIIEEFNVACRERAPEKLVELIAADSVMEGTGPGARRQPTALIR